MKVIIGFLVLFSSGLFAAGGQSQWNNPIFSLGCVATLPAGIDLDNCVESNESPSGIKVYFCEGELITVECPDDGEQALKYGASSD